MTRCDLLDENGLAYVASYLSCTRYLIFLWMESVLISDRVSSTEALLNEKFKMHSQLTFFVRFLNVCTILNNMPKIEIKYLSWNVL